MRSDRQLLDQGCRDDQRQDNKFHRERQLVLVVKDRANGCCCEDNGDQSECHGEAKHSSFMALATANGRIEKHRPSGISRSP
ncbi:MAG: hypothetical protein EBU26_14925 [Verrucomicrobia bacterium]|nr:hypothetical protein [Verrucomicrobiota bacterium]